MNGRRQSNSVFEQTVLTQLGDIKALCATEKQATTDLTRRVGEVEGNTTVLGVKVEKHDRIYVFGRWAGVPLLMVLHIALKSFTERLGWK